MTKKHSVERNKPQGPEEMCLSLEHQNPSKTSEKMGYFDRVTVKIGLQYKIRKGRKQIWGRFSNP